MTIAQQNQKQKSELVRP